VGETIITVFERRILRRDPGKRHFLSRLIWAHGLDEARHVQFDHYVFRTVIPELTDQEWTRFGQILGAQNLINKQMGDALDRQMLDHFGVDFVAGNPSRQFQDRLQVALVTSVFRDRHIKSADDVLDPDSRAAVAEFSGSARIHQPTAEA
jgi:hypothetical protein